MSGRAFLGTPERRTARRRALEHALFGVVPVLWLIYLVSLWISRDVVAFDFHHYYWPAGDRVLHGLSPYIHGPWYPQEVPVGFVYPAPASVIFAVIAAVPREVGDVVFTVLALGAPLLTLWLLDVRDWRVYGIVMLWPAIGFGAQTANLSMLFTLAVAAMWRYRDRPRTVGVIFGVVVAMKMFLFPLGLFFLATRRFGALVYAVGTALFVMAFAWLVVGVDELARYRDTVDEFTSLREDYGYSVVGFVERLGGARPVAYAVAIALAGAVAVGCIVAGLRGRGSASFILGLAAALLATPILWLHYFVFLLIPVAIRCPALHPLWALPLVMYVDIAEVNPTALQVALAMVIAALVVGGSLLARPPRPLRAHPAQPA